MIVRENSQLNSNPGDKVMDDDGVIIKATFNALAMLC